MRIPKVLRRKLLGVRIGGTLTADILECFDLIYSYSCNHSNKKLG